MNKSKNTKRALLGSVIAMILCCTMLLGTTFAWFTDSASAGVNKIQSGKLDIELQYASEYNEDGTVKTWSDAEGKTLNFIKAKGAEAEPILWEPGCEYELPAIRVVNKGNLALKYEIVVTGIDGNAKLLEAIEWTANGSALAAFIGELTVTGAASDAIVIKGHMKESAGNEYQDLTAEGISITVYATQYTYENDSYDNMYDEMASFLNVDENGTYLINDAADLYYFAYSVNTQKNMYEGKTVKLVNNIDLENKEWTPIGSLNASDANGNPSFRGTFDGNGKTISNLYISEKYADKNGVGFFASNAVYNEIVVKDLTIDGATVYGNKWVGVVQGYTYGTVTGCTVKNATVYAINGYRAGAVVGFTDGTGSVTSNKAENCTVYVSKLVSEAYNECIGTDATDNAATNISTNTAVNSKVVIPTLVDTAEEVAEILSGKKLSGDFILGSDVDMEGETIKSMDAGYNGSFTFDGNGYTLSNVEVETGNQNGMSNPGLFYNYSGSTLVIKNLVIDGLSAADPAGVTTYGTALLVGYNEGTLIIEDVTITDSTVSGRKAGLFVGYTTGDVTITNCVATGCIVDATQNGGAYIGHLNGATATITNSTNDAVDADGNVLPAIARNSGGTIIIDGVVQ